MKTKEKIIIAHMTAIIFAALGVTCLYYIFQGSIAAVLGALATFSASFKLMDYAQKQSEKYNNTWKKINT